MASFWVIKITFYVKKLTCLLAVARHRKRMFLNYLKLTLGLILVSVLSRLKAGGMSFLIFNAKLKKKSTNKNNEMSADTQICWSRIKLTLKT